MEQFVGCDAHKKFSVFVGVNECHSGPQYAGFHIVRVADSILSHAAMAIENRGRWGARRSIGARCPESANAFTRLGDPYQKAWQGPRCW
jgi:hypothetical protein